MYYLPWFRIMCLVICQEEEERLIDIIVVMSGRSISDCRVISYLICLPGDAGFGWGLG